MVDEDDEIELQKYVILPIDVVDLQMQLDDNIVILVIDTVYIVSLLTERFV